MIGFVGKIAATMAMVAAALLAVAIPAQAFEGGGRKPSEAPSIAPGEHNTGQLTNRQDDANFGGDHQVAIWRLPPLSPRDVIYVNWHSVPATHSPGYFPVCMTFAQGIDDYSWGGRFDQAVGFECEASSGPIFTLSGSGAARTEIVAQEASSDSSYIEFFTQANVTVPAHFESFPYDFSVEPPLHHLGVALREVKRVSATGVLRAIARLADGQPVPDGVSFELTVTWDGGGSAGYTGVSSAGIVSFQLALPETAYGERATFLVTHPADGSYIEASSKLKVLVAKPRPPALSPCARLKRHERSLRRRHKRIARRSRRARGAARRVLRRRAKRVRRKIRATHRRARSVCRA